MSGARGAVNCHCMFALSPINSNSQFYPSLLPTPQHIIASFSNATTTALATNSFSAAAGSVHVVPKGLSTIPSVVEDHQQTADKQQRQRRSNLEVSSYDLAI